MDPATLLFAAFSTTVVAGASVAAYLGSELRLRRTLRRAPRWSLAALPEDTFGRVTGTAYPLDGEQLIAPLTGRPCVYFIAIVEQLGARRNDPTRWTRLALERNSLVFMIEDRGTFRSAGFIVVAHAAREAQLQVAIGVSGANV